MADKVKKVAELSAQSNLALDELRNRPNGATFAELKSVVDGLGSAHLTALRTRGLVDCEDVEVVVSKKETVKRWFVK